MDNIVPKLEDNMAATNAIPPLSQFSDTRLSLWGAPIHNDELESQTAFRPHNNCQTTVLQKILGTGNARCFNCGRTFGVG
jgi:hypothetical protein